MPLAEAPTWFLDAIEQRPDTGRVDVLGAGVHWLAWGDPEAPGLVLVHGGGAHAGWWSHIAPAFAEDYRVVALDLSGHGDSDHRGAYDRSTWATEVVVAATAAGITEPPVVVGHSMGGFVTITVAAEHRDHIAGAVIIDSPVIDLDPELAEDRRPNFSNARTYPDKATAVGRFRTIPEQAHYLPYVVANIAEHSVCENETGWRWKFDPHVFASPFRPTPELLTEITCRVALFRTEAGLVSPDIGRLMYESLGRVAPVIEIPTAGHHPMLDQPLALITGLRTLLADWEHSTPVRRS